MTRMTIKLLAGVIALCAFAFGGAALATGASSSVKDTTTTTTTTSTSQPSFPEHGTPAHEDAEKPVTGDDATKAKAAAVKAAGSGTAGAVTTDFRGSGYEVTVTKSDGSTVEIHLDASFNVMQGPGGGDHGGFGHGGPGNGENALTGDTATKAKAAALTKVGGTVDAATTETDSSNSAAAYEVHVTKTDGSHVEVILDKDFTVLSVETRPQHGPYGPDGSSTTNGRFNGFFLGR
jgi:uncharacterized membrane protein YkoI